MSAIVQILIALGYAANAAAVIYVLRVPMRLRVPRWVLVVAVAALLSDAVSRLLQSADSSAPAGVFAAVAAAAALATALGLWRVLVSGPEADAERETAEAAESEAVEMKNPAVAEPRTADESLPPSSASDDARIAEYNYMISHDLQEPLRMVTGFSQLLQRRYSDKLDAQGQEFLRMTSASAVRMSAMLNDLLTLSRIDRASIEGEVVPLHDVFEAAVAKLRRQITETDADVTAEPSLPSVHGSRGLLIDALVHIIDNSLKFRGEQPPRVRISAVVNDDECVLSVRDNGIGLDERFSRRIFRPFQRLHTQETYAGTGMGLALVARIVERHGGRVEVDSVSGEGAEFRLYLPSSQEKRTAV